MRYGTQVMILLCAMLLSACSLFDIPEPDAYLRTQVIFSADAAEAQQLAMLIGESVDSYWTPMDVEVQAMSAAVIRYLVGQEEHEIIDHYDDYLRQYFGYMVGDEQYIYGNYICNDWDIDWRTQFVGVDDGGNCYFQALYNQASGEIVWVTINGDG